MQKRLRKTRKRLILPLMFLFFFVANFAFGDTYRGMLTQQTQDPPRPIVIELEDSKGKISGTVSISSSLAGPIFAAEISNYKCVIYSDVGGGVILSLIGTCTPAALVGRYVMRSPNERPRQGTFKLFKTQSEKKAPSKTETQPKTDAQAADKTQPERPIGRHVRGGLAAPTITECLKANTACLGACPRSEYNAEFLCTNSCKRKLAACKERAKNSTKNPPVKLD